MKYVFYESTLGYADKDLGRNTDDQSLAEDWPSMNRSLVFSGYSKVEHPTWNKS